MQRLEVSGAVRPLYGSLGVKGLSGSGEIRGDDLWPRHDVSGHIDSNRIL